MKRMRFQYLCVLFVALLCVGTLAFGQTDRATITGTVSDPTGAVVAGAQVLATDTATGTSHSGTSNSAGIYTIPALPVGTYTLKVSQQGFKDYVQTDIILIAAQVARVNVHMAVGSADQSVTVTGGVPLLETETSSVSMTMEASALRDLPLNASGGRDAMNLMLATTPMATGNLGGQATAFSVQNWNNFAGHTNMTNSVYIDGIEATAGIQGQIATPGQDALSEVQLITSPSDAEFGTAGGVEMFQIKSGTNKFHGSVFEFLQNEALNANSWSNNYYLSQCAPGDASCRASNSRGFDRFNDYGASAGAPIWKNRAFIFGGFELYKFKDMQTIPNSVTVPTPQMLTGDFSQLLTGGTHQGNIPDPSTGQPWINPCTGSPYQYGQIFDPKTQRTVSGVTCATPFSGNVIPAGRLSTVSQQIAGLYSKDFAPTISSRIYDNFPSLASGSPTVTKLSLDFKFDYTFSPKHHFSAGLDHIHWVSTNSVGSSGLNYAPTASPLQNMDEGRFPTSYYRIVDTYSITPTLINTLGLGFNENDNVFAPEYPANSSTYGIPGPTSPYFPLIQLNGQTNGISTTPLGTSYQGKDNAHSYQYQDTVAWMKGRHNIKFGGTLKAEYVNNGTGQNIQNINFSSETGGPVDPRLTPWVGSALANMMLGDVQSNHVSVNVTSYPHRTKYALFFQDNYRATPKLTLNLGLRWDLTGRMYEKYGHLQNFDLTAQNPNWAPYTGAWVFSKGPGTSFETNEDYHQFGPHIGAAYRITDKLVARASYGLFYLPDNVFNISWGGGYPSTQTFLAFPTNQVTNSIPGSVAYNWDNGYPGVNVLGPQNSTNTIVSGGGAPLYTHPDFLHVGHSNDWYAGLEYAVNNKVALDVSYVANRVANIQDAGRSLVNNYPSWSTYAPLWASGKIYATVNSAATAAAAGVPYPYPGFSGPAYAAIAPHPQLASIGTSANVFGDPDYGAVSAYNALVIEVKARSYRGLYLDFSDTVSKSTGSSRLDGFTNDWGYPAQNLADWQDAKHWLAPNDQRNLLKGYLTYQLPFGKGRQWFSGVSRPLNEAVGGWEIGYYGAYGSGFPMGAINAPLRLPGYFGNQRINYAPGITQRNIQNHFHGHLDLANVNDTSNNAFSPALFAPTTATAPFGNTPESFNHWRWNSQPAQENMSLLKRFDAGGERVKVTLGVEFYNVFNRHYYGAPGEGYGSPSFGQVTSVSGNRVGQLRARVDW